MQYLDFFKCNIHNLAAGSQQQEITVLTSLGSLSYSIVKDSNADLTDRN